MKEQCNTPHSFEAVRERMRKAMEDSISKARLVHGGSVSGGEIEYWAEHRLEMRAEEVAELYALLFFVQSETGRREPTPIGLFWQTADGRWHFSPGSFSRGDIHDNGRPIHMALLGEEAK